METDFKPLKFNIGIDGTSGVGKGTLCKLFAKKYGKIHFDAGSGFRTYAYVLNEMGISPETFDPNNLDHIDVTYDEKGFLYRGKPLGNKIRTAEMGKLSAKFANIGKGFKSFIIKQERKILEAKNGNWIGDGRNCMSDLLCDMEETVMFIYLYADPRVKAERRYKDLEEKGLLSPEITVDSLELEIAERDIKDYQNTGFPFLRPYQAEEHYDLVLDTSKMSVEEEFEYVDRELTKKLKEKFNL